MSCIVNNIFLLKICISHKYMLHIILHTAKYSLNTYMCDISVKHKMYLWVTHIFILPGYCMNHNKCYYLLPYLLHINHIIHKYIHTQ